MTVLYFKLSVLREKKSQPKIHLFPLKKFIWKGVRPEEKGGRLARAWNSTLARLIGCLLQSLCLCFSPSPFTPLPKDTFFVVFFVFSQRFLFFLFLLPKDTFLFFLFLLLNILSPFWPQLFCCMNSTVASLVLLSRKRQREHSFPSYVDYFLHSLSLSLKNYFISILGLTF